MNSIKSLDNIHEWMAKCSPETVRPISRKNLKDKNITIYKYVADINELADRWNLENRLPPYGR